MNEHVAAFDRLLEPNIGSVRASERQLDCCTGKQTKTATGTDVLTILEDWIIPDVPTTVIGDMNWNWEEGSTHLMKQFLEDKGFQQMIRRATHDKGNCIDHLYLNQKLLDLQPKVEQQSAYFSDHDILTMSFPEIKLVN